MEHRAAVPGTAVGDEAIALGKQLHEEATLEIALHEVDRFPKSVQPYLRQKNWEGAQIAYQQTLKHAELLIAAGVRPGIKGLDEAALKRAKNVIKSSQAGMKVIQPHLDKLAKQQAAAEQAATALREKCGTAPVLSGWDGELPDAESLLKKNAHDPDSVDVEQCTQPVLSEKYCWVSTCKVRGKNAFGALVLNHVTFGRSKHTIQTIEDE